VERIFENEADFLFAFTLGTSKAVAHSVNRGGVDPINAKLQRAMTCDENDGFGFSQHSIEVVVACVEKRRPSFHLIGCCSARRRLYYTKGLDRIGR
jgi:hypothetical protein